MIGRQDSLHLRYFSVPFWFWFLELLMMNFFEVLVMSGDFGFTLNDTHQMIKSWKAPKEMEVRLKPDLEVERGHQLSSWGRLSLTSFNSGFQQYHELKKRRGRDYSIDSNRFLNLSSTLGRVVYSISSCGNLCGSNGPCLRM